MVPDGLPLFGGARIAVVTTLVSALHCDGSARGGAASRDGVALAAGGRPKERTDPAFGCPVGVVAFWWSWPTELEEGGRRKHGVLATTGEGESAKWDAVDSAPRAAGVEVGWLAHQVVRSGTDSCKFTARIEGVTVVPMVLSSFLCDQGRLQTRTSRVGLRDSSGVFFPLSAVIGE